MRELISADEIILKMIYDSNWWLLLLIFINYFWIWFFVWHILVCSMHISLAITGLLFVVGANCGEKDFDAVVLNSNLFGGTKSDLPEDSPYWWMSKGSPFKRAVASGPSAQQFDFAANPFLRGKFLQVFNTYLKLKQKKKYFPNISFHEWKISLNFIKNLN